MPFMPDLPDSPVTTPSLSIVASPLAHLARTPPRLHTEEGAHMLFDDATVIQVVPWRDAFIDRIGHHPRSDYVERFWLAVLGPSTTWFVRSLSWGLAAAPDGFALDLRETARALGISERLGRNSPFLRAVARSCQFDLTSVDGVHPSGRTILRARTTLPWLSRRLAASLTPSLRAEHQLWLDASPRPSAAARPSAARSTEPIPQNAS